MALFVKIRMSILKKIDVHYRENFHFLKSGIFFLFFVLQINYLIYIKVIWSARLHADSRKYKGERGKHES